MARFLLPVLLTLIPAALLAVILWAFATGSSLDLPQAGRGYLVRVELPSADRGIPLPQIAGRASGEDDSSLPLVVIDPGHGGHDPGASNEGLQEKDLVLRLARALRERLLEQGDVRVALTRDEDRYLLHAERYEIARRLGADLFVSIHADSAGEASEVAGASIYTLSESASSQAAARFAERENRSDRINGQDIAGQSDIVNTILVELSQRRTQAESAEFASLIEREGEGTIRFHPQPRRSAALKVLRAPDVPSVLYESGFISNSDEAQRLASPAGRARFAEAMARAIRIYFIRQREDLLEQPSPAAEAASTEG